MKYKLKNNLKAAGTSGDAAAMPDIRVRG